MKVSTKPAAAAWLASLPWPAWAAQSNPGIDPTLFVIGVAGAFAAGVAVGYAIGKSSASGDDDNKG